MIAIVEDEAAVRLALTMLMETLGYQVVSGEGPDDVLAQLDGNCVPDVILADYRLRGGLTGFQAISRIREQLGRPLPAIMVTGDTSSAWQAEARQSRLPVLQKPVLARRLVAAIEQALA
ncbi:MAG TPA: response regulator [Candidatus Omnitrophota bacterium]|nr:response regulator [Candidatus Omnitrophota bacterium]